MAFFAVESREPLEARRKNQVTLEGGKLVVEMEGLEIWGQEVVLVLPVIDLLVGGEILV